MFFFCLFLLTLVLSSGFSLMSSNGFQDQFCCLLQPLSCYFRVCNFHFLCALLLFCVHLWISDVCDSIFRTLETLLSAVSFLSWLFSSSAIGFLCCLVTLGSKLPFMSPGYSYESWPISSTIAKSLPSGAVFLRPQKCPPALWEHVHLSTQGSSADQRGGHVGAPCVCPLVAQEQWPRQTASGERNARCNQKSLPSGWLTKQGIFWYQFYGHVFFVSEMRLLLCSGETQQLLV